MNLTGTDEPEQLVGPGIRLAQLAQPILLT